MFSLSVSSKADTSHAVKQMIVFNSVPEHFVLQSILAIALSAITKYNDDFFYVLIFAVGTNFPDLDPSLETLKMKVVFTIGNKVTGFLQAYRTFAFRFFIF